MNDTIRTLTDRRSCRSFRDEHVDRVLLEQIVEAGLHAPTGRNLQTPRFVVVTDDKAVAELSRLNAAVMGTDNDPFYGAKDVIIVLAAKQGTYIYDGSLAMGNLLNAAYALDVGACWIHRAREVFAGEEGLALLRKWGIDEEVEGIGFCILGYVNEPKAKIEPREGRVFYVTA